MDNPLLTSLNIDPKSILINMVGFVLLLVICQKLVFGPIAKLLAERAADINAGYDKIDADQKAMETARDDYQRRLNAIEEERRETVQKAINEAQATRDQIVHEAQARAQEMVSRAEMDVAHEREQAMIALRGQVIDLALGATTRLIGDGLDETRQRRLIDDFITAGTSNGTATATVGA